MCVLYFVIGVVDIFLSLTFHTQLNNVFFLIFLSTNTAEATEFLQFYATRLELICALIGFIGLSAFFFALSLRPAPLPQDRIHRARSIQIAGIMLIVGSCVIGIKLHRLSQNETSIQLYLREKNALMRWYDAIESSIAERHAFIKEYHDLSKRLDENLAARHSLPTKEILANAQNLPLLVLVIGESTQRNYLSLYGYPLPTTPRLEALEQAGNLVLFRDFISSFPNTDRSLQRALTFSHYENALTPWWEQQNLIDILNLAEYKTHWISNQDMFSIYGNSPEILSRRAHITRFSAMTDSQRSNRATDGVLLPILDQIRVDSQNLKPEIPNPKRDPQNTSQPMFYVIHLMGAHLTYGERFPKSFARFSIQDLQESGLDSFPNGQKLTKSQLRTKVNYLNAIFYGDWVLSEICKRFKNKDALVLYLSDHGDEVYDWRDFAGHIQDARFSFEVPAFAYVSDTFKRNHPEILSVSNPQKISPL